MRVTSIKLFLRLRGDGIHLLLISLAKQDPGENWRPHTDDVFRPRVVRAPQKNGQQQPEGDGGIRLFHRVIRQPRVSQSSPR